MRRAILILAIFLSGCRYTFWPLIPEEVPYPERTSIQAQLTAQTDSATAQVEVFSLVAPGWLELRWYQDEALRERKTLFVRQLQSQSFSFPYQKDGLYRLVVLFEGQIERQLELGQPVVPEADLTAEPQKSPASPPE